MFTASLRLNTGVIRVIEKMKTTTMPNNFIPRPALIRSVGFTLLCKRIIAFGGVAKREKQIKNKHEKEKKNSTDW